MRTRFFCYFFTSVLIVGTAFLPTASFAAGSYYYDYYTDYNTDAGYVETETDYTSIDTSWFDYQNPKKVYKITTEGQLRGLASLVNEKQTSSWKPSAFETFEGVTFELENDIKLTHKWTPIGSDSTLCFKGIFDGNGHTISGFRIKADVPNTGFIGYLDGTVRNLNLKGKISSAYNVCGAVAGYMTEDSDVTDCTANVAISAGYKTGGIVGYNDRGTVSGCINYADVVGKGKVGGVVGENWGTVRRCGNRGGITSYMPGGPTYGTGGVAGRSVSSTSLISYCYNAGDINSTTYATGGVVGYSNAEGARIMCSYNVGDIKVTRGTADNSDKKKSNVLYSNILNDSYTGGILGIAGTNNITITKCYNAGTIKSSNVKGGIVGHYTTEYADIGYRLKDDIIDNYYLSTLRYGIGSDSYGSSLNVSNGTASASSGMLVNIDTLLGAAYMNDNGGACGSNGFPVLVWQEPVTEVNKDYIPHISVALQNRLDKYLNSDEGKNQPGGTVKMLFNPNIFISSTVAEYNENDNTDNEKALNYTSKAKVNSKSGDNSSVSAGAETSEKKDNSNRSNSWSGILDILTNWYSVSTRPELSVEYTQELQEKLDGSDSITFNLNPQKHTNQEINNFIKGNPED